MTAPQAAEIYKLLADSYPTLEMPAATAAEWRKWLQALPYDVGCEAVLVICATKGWPKISDLVTACGIAPEVVPMLVSAREGGWEIVQDRQSRWGWRSSKESGGPALPEARGVPCPPELRGEIARRIGKIADEKRVPAVSA